MCVKFGWFTSHCKAVGEGLLYITHLGGLNNVTVGKELLQAARGARSQYTVYLAENKNAKEKVRKSVKRKFLKSKQKSTECKRM